MKQPREDWPRLGSYVVSARQSAGFGTRRAFAAAIGVTDRTLGKLEGGDRVGVSTLAAIAKAVGWTPDSPRRILAGGEPEPQSPRPTALRPVPAPDPPSAADPDFPEDDNDDAISQLVAGNDALEAIWRLRDADGKPYPREERIRLMRAHLEGMRARARRAERDTGT